jgi:hypothetical protein
MKLKQYDNVVINEMNELNEVIEISELQEIKLETIPGEELSINQNVKMKKTNSLLEYILKHRQDVLEKLETAHFNKIEEKNQLAVDDIHIKHMRYYQSIKWYSVFMLYGFVGGIFINGISGSAILRFDMFFNIMISPIIYYHSPKNILNHIECSDFIKYYTLPFICGLQFRFLDKIPQLNSFVLNPQEIQTPLQIVLVSIVGFGIILLSLYYLFISSNPFVNGSILIAEFIFILTFNYYYYRQGGNFHVHHYFLALIIMMISKNYHSKLVIVIHSIAYAIYIEGISGWGYGKIFW